MKKSEFIALLDTLDIPVSEGIINDTNTNHFPRIVYEEIHWDPINASNQIAQDVVDYEISFFSTTPRHPQLLKLRKILSDKGIRPEFYHESVEKTSKRFVHSMCVVQVLEDIGHETE